MRVKSVCLSMFLIVLLAAAAAGAEDYVIGAGDKLNIAVWGEADLSLQAAVRPDGKVTMPGIGDVVAEGKTPMQLQSEIASKLSRLIKDPIVTVTLIDVVNSRAYVVGGGVKPAVYDLKQKTTLLQLMSTIDVTAADLRNSYVLRNGQKVKTDFYELYNSGAVNMDIPIENGDMVFFPGLKERFIYVLGAVNTPKQIPYRDGITVLDVILECGGFNKFADENDTKIVRRKGDQTETIKVKGKNLIQGKDLSQNQLLQQGDYVIVEESFF